MFHQNLIQVAPLSSEKQFSSSINPNMQHGPIKETPTSLKIIGDIIVDSALDSTMHGIPHFFRRHHLVNRIFWAVCFLASAGVCSWLIAQTITDFLDFDTVTKTQSVHLVTTEFPTVSICNVNAYMTNTSYEFVKSVLVSNGLMNPVAPPEATFRFFLEDTLKLLRFVTGMNAFSSLSNATRRSFGYRLEDMLLSCTYNLNPCTANDFEWYYDINFGNCYKFNGGNKQTKNFLKLKYDKIYLKT